LFTSVAVLQQVIQVTVKCAYRFTSFQICCIVFVTQLFITSVTAWIYGSLHYMANF